MKSQVQTSFMEGQRTHKYVKSQFHTGVKVDRISIVLFCFVFYDRKDRRQLNQHKETSWISDKGSRGSGVHWRCKNKHNKKEQLNALFTKYHTSVLFPVFTSRREGNAITSPGTGNAYDITNDDIKINFYFILPLQYPRYQDSPRN